VATLKDNSFIIEARSRMVDCRYDNSLKFARLEGTHLRPNHLAPMKLGGLGD